MTGTWESGDWGLGGWQFSEDTMTLQAIRNGLYASMTASFFSTAEVSTCDFGIMEKASASCVMLMPGVNSYIEPLTDGTTRMKRIYWDILGRGYIKFKGNPKDMLARAWQIHDDIYALVNADDTLGGMADAAMVKSFSFNPDVAVDMGGVSWGVVTFRITAEEF